VSFGANRGLARNRVCFCDVGWFRCIEFSFTENAFEGLAREPNDVASGVHVKGDLLGRVRADGEGEGVVAAGRKRQRDLAVTVKARGGASGGGFEEVVGSVEMGFGEGVC
jgi:hypothetical protein